MAIKAFYKTDFHNSDLMASPPTIRYDVICPGVGSQSFTVTVPDLASITQTSYDNRLNLNARTVAGTILGTAAILTTEIIKL